MNPFLFFLCLIACCTLSVSAQTQRTLIKPPAPLSESKDLADQNAAPCDLCGSPFSDWIKGVNIEGGSGFPMNAPNNNLGCYTFNLLDWYYAILKVGQYHSFSLTPGFPGASQPEFWKIWIDLNRDGDFDDPYDLVYDSDFGSNTTVQDSFFIPFGTSEGATTMRIAMRRGNFPPNCGNYTNGQVITYNTVYIDECNISFLEACAREYIQQVKIETIDNASGCGVTGYQDFTSQFANLRKDSTYQITLTPGFTGAQHPERWLVWIDLNKDNDFDDADEKVYDSGTTGISGQVTGLIHIPPGAPVSTTRMRVKMIPTDAGANSTDPCDPIPTLFVLPDQFGEAEDYTVKIKGVSLEVQNGVSPQTLVQELIGGECFDITNITYSGDAKQIGRFSKGLTNIGFNTGIILSTGDINLAPGPNDAEGTTVYASGISDPDLSQMTGNATYDRASLEFDITPTQSSLTLEYVFASEEYCEYIDSDFKDAFGIFISGPNINGPFNGAANLAVLPGPGTYVNIGTINHLVNSGLYVNNQSATSNNLCGQLPSTQPAVQQLQYDGFTRKMTAIANVIPCQTYHVKLKIADVGDQIYDSALFLKAGSLDAGGNASVEWQVNGDPGITAAGEGCGTTQLVFRRVGGNISTPLLVEYSILGTATPAVDFSGIPASVIIPAGQEQVVVTVNLLKDQLSEGAETIIIQLAQPCSCTNTQATLSILDAAPMIIQSNNQTICGPGIAFIEVGVSGGYEPYSYMWNTGGTTDVIVQFVTTTRSYTVSVTDNCGNSQTATVQVIVSPLPHTNLAGQQIQICPGQPAYLPVALVGSAPFNFNYNINGIPQLPINNISGNSYFLEVTAPGLYMISEVTDASGCTGQGIGTATVSVSSLNITGTATNINCNGTLTGSINTIVTGAQGNSTYSWQGPTSIGNIANPVNLGPGSYSVTITDGSGCIATQNFTINAPPPIIADVMVNCDDLTISASGGTGILTYSINGSGFQSSNQFTNLPNGNYTCYIKDANQCIVTKQASISNTLTINASMLNPLCFGGQNGQITATAGGGVPPLSFSLNGSPPQSSNVFGNLAAGNYAVVVSDNTGCSAATGSLILNNPQPLQITAMAMQNTITVQASGGTGFLSYSSNGVNYQPGNQFFNMPNGTYTITVKDANGCTQSTLVVVCALSATAQASTILCAGGVSTLTITPDCGISPFSYQLNGGPFQSGNVFNGLQAGTYTTRVKDANGDIFTLLPIVINEPDPITTAVSVNCNDASLVVTGGTPPYVSNPAISTLVNLPNGSYQVVVTDSHGCSVTQTFDIQVDPLNMNVTVVNVLCNGDNTGEISVDGTGGCPPYQYSINGSVFTDNNSFNGLTFGTYSLSIKDSDNNTNFKTATVFQPQLLTLSASVSNNTIVADASGGVAPYTYMLNGGTPQSSPVFDIPANGTYTVVVTDNNGCTTSDMVVEVIEPVSLWGATVSPNPGNGWFRLTMQHAPECTQAKIFDPLGRLLKTLVLPSVNGSLDTMLDLQGYPDGAYLLLLSDGEKWGSLNLCKTSK